MKTEKSTATKILISEIDGLDPITGCLEDLGPHQGRITIICYAESWTSYWGGMGDRTISEFYCSCDKHYLAKNLSSINADIVDVDKINEDACEIDEDMPAIEQPLELYIEQLREIYGVEWWRDLPTKQNPDYQYLCRIILTVQEVLKK